MGVCYDPTMGSLRKKKLLFIKCMLCVRTRVCCLPAHFHVEPSKQPWELNITSHLKSINTEAQVGFNNLIALPDSKSPFLSSKSQYINIICSHFLMERTLGQGFFSY